MGTGNKVQHFLWFHSENQFQCAKRVHHWPFFPLKLKLTWFWLAYLLACGQASLQSMTESLSLPYIAAEVTPVLTHTCKLPVCVQNVSFL